MELKPYQQKVLNDLREFTSYTDKYQRLDTAYKEFWNSKGVFVKDINHPDGISQYKSVIPGVPHIAMKVPTAGGKTFIAANALRPLFDYLGPSKDKVVVWLVPSITILDQTVNNLNNPDHPYRQKIDTHFNGRVEVYEKEDLLQGARFNSSVVKEQLSILVLSYDSFRTKSKEGRKVYQENENLTNFFDGSEKDILLTDSDEGSLMNVIRKLNPVIIVDESHNAESQLSVEMLNNLNPSFVLDLTATPRENSNIISFVDSLELKRENMVKLPVLVYNHHEVNEVIASAVELRRNLEEVAIASQKMGGEYIRPIVLFQAQPKNNEDSETFEALKQKLIKKGIPENEIAIKTASVNEIKNEELLSDECKIRYIITVNALKEGWDCPFAYILASLANRSSKVDVEQILGRILRQPYTKKHLDALLNMSYVFTASQNFHETLESIVQGLNKAGFSKKDFRVKQDENVTSKALETSEQLMLDTKDVVEIIDESQVQVEVNEEGRITSPSSDVLEIIQKAKSEESNFEEKITSAENDVTWGYTSELTKAMNLSEVKDEYKGVYKEIRLPQFFVRQKQNELFNQGSEDIKLSSEMLLDNEFELRKQNTDINFDAISLEVYQVDIEESGKRDDYTPRYKRVGEQTAKAFIEHINSLPEEGQIRTLVGLTLSTMGRMEQFADSDLKTYVTRIIEDMDSPTRSEIKSNPYTFALKIKKHIEKLAQNETEDLFSKWLESNQIFTRESFELPNHIAPTSNLTSIPKGLYVTESDSMNNFEKSIISEIANLENVLFWHRIIERKGFYINGYLNHYPDFLIVTKTGRRIILEAKGDYLDGSNAQKKLKLGKIWANKSGNNYSYFMVFEDKPLDGAYILEELLEIIREL